MNSNHITRRRFLRMGASGMALFAAGGMSRFAGSAVPGGAVPFYNLYSLDALGTLQAPDENGIMLPVGFRSRIVARSGDAVISGGYIWHAAPDGGACYATEDGGWIYVSNSEIGNGGGGVGALRFNHQAQVVDSYSILQNTSVNCAGGKTPWNTWLSCEEHDRGQVYECDPTGQKPAQLRAALGTFEHEAVAVDPVGQHLYLTEDKPDGGFYRFVPDNPLPDISAGILEIASVTERDGRMWVSWYPLPDPMATVSDTRLQVPETTQFKGGEGIAFHEGRICFTTKGDNRLWWYDVASSELGIVYDRKTSENPILSGVDNIVITPAGDVLVAEDGGDMQIVVLTPAGKIIPLLQILGHEQSEIAGPAFDPLFQRLYFSSQRGSGGIRETGITYEITGPGGLAVSATEP